MAKKPIEIDYENILEPQLLDFLKRVEDLETAGVMETSSVQMKELEWDSNTSEIRRTIRLLKAQVADLKESVKRSKELFVSIVGDFRNKATSEDFQRLTRMVDEMKFEEYLRREDLRIIVDQLDSLMKTYNNK